MFDCPGVLCAFVVLVCVASFFLLELWEGAQGPAGPLFVWHSKLNTPPPSPFLILSSCFLTLLSFKKKPGVSP